MTKRSSLATLLLLAITTISACAVAPAEPSDGQGNSNGNGNGDDSGGGRPSDDGDDDGDDYGGPTGGTGEGADVLNAINEAECALALACEQEWNPEYGDFSQYFGTDQASCVQIGEEIYEIGAIAAAVANGTIDVDAAAAAECMQALGSVQQTACGDFFDQGLALPEACYVFLVGTVQAGGSCTLTEECADGGYCGGGTCEP